MDMIPPYGGSLPQCDGPKLKPFELPMPTPVFRRLISDKDAEGQAHIFEASIGSTAYAIKVVKSLTPGFKAIEVLLIFD